MTRCFRPARPPTDNLAPPDRTSCLLCLSYLTQLHESLASDPTSPQALAVCPNLPELANAIASLKVALVVTPTAAFGNDMYYGDNGIAKPATDNATISNYFGGLPLPDLISAGADKLQASIRFEADKEMVEGSMFKAFLKAVSGKGYFDGAEQGSDEWQSRWDKLVGKYREKLRNQKAKEGSSPDAAPASAAPPAAAVDDTKESGAKTLKDEGNAHMATKDYQAAIKSYTAALRLSPKGPSSHVYYANRSAAYCYIERFAEAEMDAERAVKTKEGLSYAKGWNRLGYCRYMMEDYVGGAEAYEKSLSLDTSNKNSTEFLKKCNEKLGAGAVTTDSGAGGAAGGGGGMPDIASLMNDPNMMAEAQRMMAGGGGGGGNPMAGLLNNPAMMQMAQQMMNNPQALQQAQSMMQNNPQMREMAQNMMGNPGQMEEMMGALGGGGGGGGAPGGGGGGNSGGRKKKR